MAVTRLTSEGLEVLHDGAAKARVSGLGLEALHSGAAKARVSALGIEVLRSVTDAPDPNLKLLLNFEGANASTGAPGMTDGSPSAHGTATVKGAAHIDTAQFKFGASSLSLNGTSDSITFPDHADWHFGSGLFTVECFIRPTSVTGTQFLIGQWGSVGVLGWQFYLNGSALAWNVSTTGSDNLVDLTGGTLAINTQAAVCVDYDGVKYRLYVNGVMVASSTVARNINNPGSSLAIGGAPNNDIYWYAGWIDAVQIYKGVAKHASDAGYAVQTAPISVGPPPPGASWSSTDAPDTMSAGGYAGYRGPVGDMLSTEAKDSFAAQGYQKPTGAMVVAESPDAFAAYGFQPQKGALASTEAKDIFSAAGIGLGVNGTWSSVEAADTLVIAVKSTVSGTFNVSGTPDRFQALGAGVTQVRRRRTLTVT